MLIDNCKEIAALWRKNAAIAREHAKECPRRSLAGEAYIAKAFELEQCAYLLKTAVKNEENLK